MLQQILTAAVDLSRRFALTITLAALLLCSTLGFYVINNISINTDINQLLSEDLDWRRNEKAIETAFPNKVDNIAIVIDGETSDKAEAAAASLAQKLASMPAQFPSVSRPDALPFFRSNGLLFLSKEELAQTLDQITQAQPMLGSVISDPSLRGLMSTIDLIAMGAQAGATDAKQLEAPLSEITKTLQAAADGKERSLDWNKMMPGGEPSPYAARELRKFIIAKPVLDFSALQPGEKATQAIRQAATELNLTPDRGVRVRLTGSVPLNDDEFSSVSEGAGLATALSAGMVLALLFLALRTWRIVAPIAITLLVGLVASTAFATFAVGSLNLISVAFAVMFIGIAVDFGIQFGVRYRDQRHQTPDHAKALRNTAQAIAQPLTVAAASTALGFFAFIPTDYRGVSELGLIAGFGMLIAFALNVTLLPALLTLTRPTPEPEGVGYKALIPLNDFLISKSRILMPILAIILVVGFAAASRIGFDFDPLNLKNPATESVEAMFDAMQDPDSNAYAAQVLTPSGKDAQELSDKLSKLPTVNYAMNLGSFVPEDQDAKLEMIADTASLLEPTFALPQQPAASDTDNLEALKKTAGLLRQAEDKIPAAHNLAEAIENIVKNGSPQTLTLATGNLISPLQSKLKEIQSLLQAKPVTMNDIPQELKSDWITPEGKWLVEALPNRGADNNPRDPAILRAFMQDIYKVAPDAAGTPASIIESGKTILSAFTQAGIYGFLAISLLSLAILRRLRDVAFMMAPVLMAGTMTLATMTATGMQLNFANIIALPLLMSLGVSYAIYFAFHGKNGRLDFLQSSMSRAVLFSAATVFVAFASLCFSTHPGTRGMGELLTISLLYSLSATFLLLPILYGREKTDKH